MYCVSAVRSGLLQMLGGELSEEQFVSAQFQSEILYSIRLGRAFDSRTVPFSLPSFTIHITVTPVWASYYGKPPA